MATADQSEKPRTRYGRTDVDVVVVGSGFGGSVAALRLVEKGYSVLVVEAGPRYEDKDLAKTSWRLRKYVWAPKLKMYGIQRIHLLKNALILAGAGVGGGSLVYANTLYRPLPPFFRDQQWAHITDWADELDPHYDQASRMLGVRTNPTHTPADVVIKSVAQQMGVGDTFHPTPVGVYFNRPGETDDDPYFGGAGPSRTGCTECGACMTGCRVGAKNSLVKNYLYLAERAGARVAPMTTVTNVRQRKDGSWEVTTERTGAWFLKRRTTMRTQHVVLAAGAWGTQNLLHRLKADGTLPHLSATLGRLTRTNSEAIVGSGRLRIDPERDFTAGVAITSSFHPDENTHIEPVRYGKGSNAMGLLQSIATEGDSDVPRWRQALRFVRQNPKAAGDALAAQLEPADDDPARHAEPRQLADDVAAAHPPRPHQADLRAGPRRSRTRRSSARATRPTRWWREEIDGIQGSTWNEMLEIPLTAHFLGGCAIGDGAGHRRRRRLPPGLQLPGPARRRRLRGLGEPRRQPVAHDHRAGRAGLLAVAEPGRGRPASGAG